MSPNQATGLVHPYPFGTPKGVELDPMYAHVRENEPACRVRMPYGGEAWLLTRHADVKLVLADPRFSMAAGAGKDVPRPTEHPLPPGGLISMDPPEHTRLRRLAGKAFTLRRVEALRSTVNESARQFLTTMAARGAPADLMEGLALPLSISVICRLLGVPYEERRVFQAFSDALMSVTLSPEEVQSAIVDFSSFMADLVAQRRERPIDDLLGAMVQARDEDDLLSEDELLMLGAGLLVGGYETTASQIGNFAYLLLSDRSRYESLVADPTLVPTAVEELLRVTPLSTVAGYARIALEDVEVGGTLIREGEAVITSIGAANWDSDFLPGGDTIDLAREHCPHLGFGHGIHYCMGAPLARLELQAALAALVEVMPELRLAVPAADVRWKSGFLLRTPEALPVTW